MSQAGTFIVTVAAIFAAAGLSGTACATDRSGEPTQKDSAESCEHALPGEVSRMLSEQFSGWKIQSSETLSATARDRWHSEKPVVCPGIARGKFVGTTSVSFAVLIIGGPDNKGQAKLVVFSPKNEQQSAYSVQGVDDIGANVPNYFIHEARVRQFFDAASTRRFRVAAVDTIVLFDAGADEYGTEVYFWTGTYFRHEPVDH
jgi:hypothetical protein